jgi:hypothetical protein
MSLMSWWRYQSKQPTLDLLGPHLDTQEPDDIVRVLRQLPCSSTQQQPLLNQPQQLETLVRLLEHNEALVRREACLALTYLLPSPQLQHDLDVGPTIAALAKMVQTARRGNSSGTTSSTKGGRRFSSSSQAMDIHGTTAVLTH